MTEEAGGLRMYAVELLVEGVAVLTVPPTSADEACDLAEQRVRPVDVSELDVVEVERVIEVEAIGHELAEAAKARAREGRAKGSGHGRQA